MTDERSSRSADGRPPVSVLYVVADRTADEEEVDAGTLSVLREARSGLVVEAVTTAAAARDALASDAVDCLVAPDRVPTGRRYDGGCDAESHPEDGVEFLASEREGVESTVLYTDRSDPEYLECAREAGVDACVPRPGAGPDADVDAGTVGLYATALADQVRCLVPAGDEGPTDGTAAAELERYRTIFETIQDGVYVLDAEGRFIAVNDAYVTMTGRSREDLLGRKAATVIGEAIFEEAETIQSTLEDDVGATADPPGVATMETELRSADGESIPVEVRISLYPLGEDFGRVGVVRDLSEQRQLERELSTVLDRITDAFFALDSDWQFTYVNERAEALLDRTEAELVGSTIWEEFAEAVDTPFQAEYERAMETQEPTTFEEYYPPLGTWFQVHAYPSETGLSVYFRDVTDRKRREERLTRLGSFARRLPEAETAEEVAELTAAAADDLLDLPVATVELYDGETGRLKRAAATTEAVDRLGDERPFATGEDVAWAAYAANEERVYDDLLAGTGLAATDTPLRSALVVPLGKHGVVVTGTTATDAFTEDETEVVRLLAAHATSALDRVERERTLRERNDALEQRNAALERLRRINDVIRDLTQALTRASTREEVVQSACDRLAAAEPFRFAWVGANDPLADTIEPVAWAGEHGGGDDPDPDLQSLVGDTDADEPSPTIAAIRSREPQVLTTAGEPPFPTWRRTALERGFRSTVAVPLSYQGSLYGALTIYSGDADAFSQLETSVLAELGDTIAYAINAVERRRALVSERSVELEFAVNDPKEPLFAFVADRGGQFTFENVVLRTDGQLNLFFSLRGVDPDEVVAFARRTEGIRGVSLISEREEDCLFECELTQSTFLAALVEHGGVPQSITMAAEGEGRLVVRIPASADVATFVDLIQRRYGRVELVARREHDEPVKTLAEFRSEFEEALTDRQEEVLRTAYHAGFFEWPRESTAEDVAEMLGISQPTVARHMRTGERRLFSLLFDD